MIHEKYDYPVVAFHGVTILEGTDLRITIHPEVIITDPDVRSLKRRQRGCLFDDEVSYPLLFSTVMVLLELFLFVERVHLGSRVQFSYMHTRALRCYDYGNVWLCTFLLAV